mmetsp:Transcript_58160/g.94022  ORF Transcript_58160/g.94022 Transcript_58160/m.94022 type:complete len:492 (+) Transcript_58160:77-1552(+)
MISMKTTVLSLGCAAGAVCVGWWWISSQQPVALTPDAERNHQKEDRDRADEALINCTHRVVRELAHAPQRASAPTLAVTKEEEPTLPFAKNPKTPAPARQAPAPTESHEQCEATEPMIVGKGVPNAAPLTAAAPDAAALAAVATTRWAALHEEGWQRAAAQDDWKCRVSTNDKWISCRAARSAASGNAMHRGTELGAVGGTGDRQEVEEGDFDNGVWCEENEDRYSGAGGRELSEGEMKQIMQHDSKEISEFWRNKYENDARRCWDVFYHINKTNFFKDRHYLGHEWPQLKEPNISVLDLGCGVGNTTLPLLALNPSIKLWSCDFSPNAVILMQESEGFDAGRCKAFVNDMTADPLTDNVEAESIDKCLLIFVLSAINPDKMVHSLQNLAGVMKAGGTVLFRDYGIHDMAEIRMAEQKGHKISDNFYVRKDGTRAYYFSERVLAQMFEEAGFVAQELKMHRRVVRNRKEQADMHRRWIQGTFVKSAGVVSL